MKFSERMLRWLSYIPFLKIKLGKHETTADKKIK